MLSGAHGVQWEVPSACSCGQPPVGVAGGGHLTILTLPTASPALRPEVWEPTVECQATTTLSMSLYAPPMGKFQ